VTSISSRSRIMKELQLTLALIGLTVTSGLCFQSDRLAFGLQSKAPPPATGRRCGRHHSRLGMVGTGLAFNDGDQILVSAQKPLGIVLEEADEGMGAIVAEIADPSASAVAAAGVEVGHRLVAVQNADVRAASIEEILERIGAAPRVINLRFQVAD